MLRRFRRRSAALVVTLGALVATLSACGDTGGDDASTIVRTTTNVAGAGAVSYTHLTLPTICSV